MYYLPLRQWQTVLFSFICSNEALSWDEVDGSSKERSSLRYFRILIQTQKVLSLHYMFLKTLKCVFHASWNTKMCFIYMGYVSSFPFVLVDTDFLHSDWLTGVVHEMSGAWDFWWLVIILQQFCLTFPNGGLKPYLLRGRQEFYPYKCDDANASFA